MFWQSASQIILSLDSFMPFLFVLNSLHLKFRHPACLVTYKTVQIDFLFQLQNLGLLPIF